ncbi:CWC16 protein [Blakeslea trispora]|nr:CWC16 protein [Blakeslea trispora]
MSERKVLNKYFPPNFDPSQIPRQKKPKDLQHKVRLMTPFTMRCESCGEYINKGKKFNARKETAEGETYLNIKIYRFYIRCPRCSAEITFKTDPKNTDYVAEHGATRNFEPWRQTEDDKESSSEDEPEDPMKSLESRTLDSKREMDIMDALDEIRTRNARSERITVDEVLSRFSTEDKAVISERMKIEEEEDEKQAKAIFQSADGEQVRKIKEAEPEAIQLVNQQAKTELPSFKPTAILQRKRKQNNNSMVVVKKKKEEKSPLSLLSNYQDISSSDSE